MIDYWNAGIAQHRADPEPDWATIDTFTDRRNIYIGQLALLLQPFEVEVKPLPARVDAAQRIAA
jgi:hypothetical protein